MFTALQTLLASAASISILLAANDDGTITVTVIPVGKKEGADPQNTPLSLTATAAELDAEFAGIVANYSGKRLSLTEQLEATTSIIDAAKKEAANEATKAIKKAGKSAPAAATSTQPAHENGSDEDDDTGEGDGNPEVQVVVAGAPKAPTAPDQNLFA